MNILLVVTFIIAIVALILAAKKSKGAGTCPDCSGGGIQQCKEGNKTSVCMTSDGALQVSGDLIVGSPSNKISSSLAEPSKIYSLDIGNAFSATSANAQFFAVTADGKGQEPEGGFIKATGNVFSEGVVQGKYLSSSEGSTGGFNYCYHGLDNPTDPVCNQVERGYGGECNNCYVSCDWFNAIGDDGLHCSSRALGGSQDGGDLFD